MSPLLKRQTCILRYKVCTVAQDMDLLINKKTTKLTTSKHMAENAGRYINKANYDMIGKV